MRKVEVVPYDERWSMLFLEECEKITSVLGNEIIDIHHIGSTAVPNMHAKPIIDILIEVQHIEKVDRFNGNMKQLGYEAMGEHGIMGRRFFRKGGNKRTHHVHIYEKGHEEIARHLAFKHYMMAHPEEAERYSELKQTLAEKFPENIESYVKGKHDYIQAVNKKAKRWISGS